MRERRNFLLIRYFKRSRFFIDAITLKTMFDTNRINVIVTMFY